MKPELPDDGASDEPFEISPPTQPPSSWWLIWPTLFCVVFLLLLYKANLSSPTDRLLISALKALILTSSIWLLTGMLRGLGRWIWQALTSSFWLLTGMLRRMGRWIWQALTSSAQVTEPPGTKSQGRLSPRKQAHMHQRSNPALEFVTEAEADPSESNTTYESAPWWIRWTIPGATIAAYKTYQKPFRGLDDALIIFVLVALVSIAIAFVLDRIGRLLLSIYRGLHPSVEEEALAGGTARGTKVEQEPSHGFTPEGKDAAELTSSRIPGWIKWTAMGAAVLAFLGMSSEGATLSHAARAGVLAFFASGTALVLLHLLIRSLAWMLRLTSALLAIGVVASGVIAVENPYCLKMVEDSPGETSVCLILAALAEPLTPLPERQIFGLDRSIQPSPHTLPIRMAWLEPPHTPPPRSASRPPFASSWSGASRLAQWKRGENVQHSDLSTTQAMRRQAMFLPLDLRTIATTGVTRRQASSLSPDLRTIATTGETRRFNQCLQALYEDPAITYQARAVVKYGLSLEDAHDTAIASLMGVCEKYMGSRISNLRAYYFRAFRNRVTDMKRLGARFKLCDIPMEPPACYTDMDMNDALDTRWLQEAFCVLDDRQTRVVEIWMKGGKDWKAIADEVGLTYGQATNAFHSAIRKMRRYVSQRRCATL